MDPWRRSLPSLLSGQVTAARSRDQGRWTFGGMRFGSKSLSSSSFPDAPSGAGPESILPIVVMDSLALRAPRNDDGELGRNPAFSRHEMSESCVNQTLENQRAQGKPDARRTRSLVCKVESRKHTSEYRYAETFRPSLRNGFAAYGALSPVSGLLATVPRALEPQGLIPASGDQDHTLL